MKDETHSYQAKMETRVAVRDDRLRSVTVLATQSQFSIGLLVPFPRRPTLVERHVITLRPCAEICNQSSAISKVLPADLAKKTALNFSGCFAPSPRSFCASHDSIGERNMWRQRDKSRFVGLETSRRLGRGCTRSTHVESQ
jgi:hypothetical protein